ncbi:MAG TPA: hypothetical protein VLQ67_14730, partial [Arachnia sp.]|nr:hypothetical protein [Arachnia sp.]
TPTVTSVVTVTETVFRPAEPTVPGPIATEVGLGSTVSLRYFDVTVSDVQRGATEMAVKVEVCYTHAHPEANQDGTTRVSRDPWSLGITDPEGAQSIEYMYVKAREFPTSARWTPVYRETRLSVGECNTGWLGIQHDNPDLWISYLRYSPADFGDQVTWDIGS